MHLVGFTVEIIVVVCRNTVNLLNKGKTIPLQVWTDPEVSTKLSLPDFKTIGTRWW